MGLVDAAHELISDIVTGNVYVSMSDGPLVVLTFGSVSAGEDGSIFASSDGKGLDAANKGVLSLGFFGTGFDVTEAGKDVDSILQNFVPLYLVDSASAGFLATGDTVVADGAGETPYLLLLGGIDDFSKGELDYLPTVLSTYFQRVAPPFLRSSLLIL